MAVQTKEVLKSYFETGDKPTQEEFADLIETLQTKDEVKEAIDEALKDMDIEGVANLLTKIEVLESYINLIKEEVDELDSKINILNADAQTEGSVENKINSAFTWAKIT